MNARLTYQNPSSQPRSTIRQLQLLPLLLWAGATNAWSAPVAQLFIQGSWNNAGNSVAFSENRDTYTSPVSVSGLGLTMTASVQPGILMASMSGAGSWSTTGAPPPDDWVVSTGVGLVQVGNAEDFTLSVPGFSGGEAAEVTFSYYLPGQFAVSHSGRANAVGDFLWQGAGLSLRREESHVPQNIPADVSLDTLPLGRVITVTRTVSLGFAFSEGQFMQLGGASTPPEINAVGSSSFDLDFSAYWNGVSQVTVEGVPVSGYSLVNSEGVNFNNTFAPVPEPEHYAAFAAAGLLAFGLWRRSVRRA